MSRFRKQAQKKMAEVMKELENGSLMSVTGTVGRDKPVTSHKKAQAIAVTEARKIDGKVTKKKSPSEKK